MSTACVTICDQNFFSRAKRTVLDLRTRGQWSGDIVLITIGFNPSQEFLDSYNLTYVSFPLIDKSELVSKIKAPFEGSDRREINKLNQWEKLHLFDPYFRRWERIVFFDAGHRIFDQVEYLLQLDYKGKILAPNDAGFYNRPDKIFRHQLSFHNPELIKELKEEFGDVFDSQYFLNCIWVYDTSIQEICSKEEMIKGMNKYPLCRTNEMTIMNLYLHFKYKLWEAFPNTTPEGKYLFEWNETNHPHPTTWRDYCYIKYPFSINFEDF